MANDNKNLEEEIYKYIKEIDPQLDRKQLIQIIAAAVLGSASAYVSAKVVPRVMNDVRAVDINNLRKDPKGEVKKLVDRLKQDGIEMKQEITADVDDVRKQGIFGYTRGQISRVKDEYFLNLFRDNYCYPSELKIESIDIIIGNYIKDKPIRREHAESVRKFVTALRLDYSALPTNLGYKEEGLSSRVRKMILMEFTGYATTDVEEVIRRLEYLQENRQGDPDPTVTRCELEVLNKYRDKIKEKEGKMF